MKTVLLHGLGQTAKDWEGVRQRLSAVDIDCPELFTREKNEISYFEILENLEKQYANTSEPIHLCGLSLGAILALDFTIRHGKQVSSLILIAPQYKVPGLLIDFQNLLFRCIPNKSFDDMGISKNNMIRLSHSMRSLDFSDQLDKIICPVTIVCGEKDSANRRASIKLKELLPQAELHIIAGAGHEINKVAPKEIASILNESIIKTIPEPLLFP